MLLLFNGLQVLAGNAGNITTALSEYNRVRLPDVSALHTLDRMAPDMFGGGTYSACARHHKPISSSL